MRPPDYPLWHWWLDQCPSRATPCATPGNPRWPSSQLRTPSPCSGYLAEYSPQQFVQPSLSPIWFFVFFFLKLNLSSKIIKIYVFICVKIHVQPRKQHKDACTKKESDDLSLPPPSPFLPGDQTPSAHCLSPSPVSAGPWPTLGVSVGGVGRNRGDGQGVSQNQRNGRA